MNFKCKPMSYTIAFFAGFIVGFFLFVILDMKADDREKERKEAEEKQKRQKKLDDEIKRGRDARKNSIDFDSVESKIIKLKTKSRVGRA